MRGIDISRYQGWPFNATAAKGFKESDFVIIKATEGLSYRNPYVYKSAKKAMDEGKLLGFYHYANGGDPRQEAAYFYSVVKDYVGDCILFVDWEGTNNPKFGKDDQWCLRFLNHLHDLADVKGGVYVSASAINQVKSCSYKYHLWVAGYPFGRNSWDVPKFPYKVAPWSHYGIWQFTSSGGKLDRNTSDWTKEQWESYEKRCCDQVEYVVKLGTNVRTGWNLKYKKVDYLRRGTKVKVDKIRNDRYGRTWGHIGKYRWFVIKDSKKTRAVKA